MNMKKLSKFWVKNHLINDIRIKYTEIPTIKLSWLIQKTIVTDIDTNTGLNSDKSKAGTYWPINLTETR